ALDGATLARIQNNALKVDRETKVKPFQMAEVFDRLTNAIWADPLNGAKGKKQVELSIVKRNLQREYVKRLNQMVLGNGGSVPPDAKSLARLHLREVTRRVERLLTDGAAEMDATTRAHLEEVKER